jgi:hypothetical protein
MELNPELKGILSRYNIPYDEGMLGLLGIYHGINIKDVVSERVQKQLNVTGIVEREYEDDIDKPYVITWNIPLYIGQEVAWEWVQEWRTWFRRINPARGSNLKTCIGRMKWLFSEYPDIRKEEVMEATKLYFRSVNDAQFLKSADKFIREGRSKLDYVSGVLQWVEILRENRGSAAESKPIMMD